MITIDHRPRKFEDVAGQEHNVRILRAMVRRPEDSPRSIILCGAFGSGKTTLARIFANALNCESPRSAPCGSCPSCIDFLSERSVFYTEYDSSVVGNVERIKELRDTFYYRQDKGYKIIVFDEAHLVSRQALSALLKVIEEAPPRVFFIFCTTDVDKLLPTIRSRSIELKFSTVPQEQMKNNLISIAEKLGKDIPADILDAICKKSGGHMRNAHMLLDQFFLIGKEEFEIVARTSRPYFVKYFASILTRNRKECFASIDALLTFSIADLKQDFQSVLLEMVQILVCQKPSDEECTNLVKILGADVIKIYKNCIADWVLESFRSDELLRATLLALWQLFVAMRGSR